MRGQGGDRNDEQRRATNKDDGEGADATAQTNNGIANDDGFPLALNWHSWCP
eukprot:CAMPEP_0172565700 /NCGR_PEP_ID=MMETSP1067-20121228/109186_1 /TAXON_ID=265564 ORGANISM="Thalassiosira punctigera, Strain Tpunct2005C2" /NCGR_SAMPLE_ID=MMETSP1067 /ASSEMBLY_ACC=CAM_ASM_000444 /LENGTH=51 /DNA_ID=CAMNT_0013356643 /DNA_START=77 /DNA_END=228 /DNA_ORIENTATION=-